MAATDRERLIEACRGDGRFIGQALRELKVAFVEDVRDVEFLIARVRALTEEELGDDG